LEFVSGCERSCADGVLEEFGPADRAEKSWFDVVDSDLAKKRIVGVAGAQIVDRVAEVAVFLTFGVLVGSKVGDGSRRRPGRHELLKSGFFGEKKRVRRVQSPALLNMNSANSRKRDEWPGKFNRVLARIQRTET